MARIKNEDISLKILKITALGVLIVSASIFSPQLPYLLLKAYIKQYFRKSYSSTQMRNAVGYLKRKRFIAYKNKQFVITKLGKKFLQRQLTLNELTIKEVKWDGKWRVVTFDIPKKKVAASFVFRDKLKKLGFFHFQRSVFIIPFPCEKEIIQLADELEIGEGVHILITNRFKNDSKIVKKFNLKY